jgi:hypothetical protein
MPTNVSIRLQAEGGAQIRQELAEAGRAGETAFQGVAAAADQAAAATDRLAAAAGRARGADGRFLPGGGSGGSLPNGATPSDTTLREVERLRNRLDEEYRNATQRDRAEGIIGRGLSSGALGADDAERLRRLAGERYGGSDNDNAPGRRGLNSGQRLDLGYQLSDVVASAGSGAGAATIAFQQGPQVLQSLAQSSGGLAGGLKDLAASALALVNPFTLGLAAAAAFGGGLIALGVAASNSDKELEKSTRGMGAASGNTVEALDRVARANAEAGRVSTSTARTMAAEYNATGEIGSRTIGDLIRITERYAQVTGQEIPAATSQLAAAFADPAAKAEGLASSISTLDDKTLQLIRTQQEQGDKSAAQATLADALRAAIDANAKATTGWAAAWNVAAAAADNFWEKAKRAASVRLGTAPNDSRRVSELDADIASIDEGLARFPNRTDRAGQLRFRAEKQAERDRIAAEAAATERRAEEEAGRLEASRRGREAADYARSLNPLNATVRTLREREATLSQAVNDPQTRAGLDNIDEVRAALEATTRARETLTDADGRALTMAERSRMADQLKLDAQRARTDAEKAAVAVRQQAFEDAGKLITREDALARSQRAGALALAAASDRGGSGRRASEADDDYDRAVSSLETRLRRQDQEATTYGLGAEAVARYRTETELLTAAKKAERDINPTLLEQIREYTDRAGEAARRVEELREAQRQSDQLNSAGREGFTGFFREMRQGATYADAMANAVGRMVDRLGDIASDQLFTSLFGGRGTSGGTGLLGGLFGGLFGGGGTAAAASSPGLGDFFGGSFFPTFAGGGVTNRPSIFGEAGPEAAVPLPDGRNIPVRLSGRFTMPGANMNQAPPPAPPVVVINNTGQPIEERTTNGPQGPRKEIIVGNAFRDAMASGDLDRVMAQRFGLRAVGR